MATTLSEEEKRFVEDIGLIMEEQGRPRIAGRILGWLLICEPPQQSFTDLVEVLGVSKGSVSAMTRLLLEGGLIERVAVPSERQTYFRMAPDAWSRVLTWMAERVQRMAEAAERRARSRPAAPPRRRPLAAPRDARPVPDRAGQVPQLI